MKVSQTHTENVCRKCLKPLDAATHADGKSTPNAGDVSICFYCGTLSLYDDQLRLRQPTVDEMEVIISDEENWNMILHIQRGIKLASQR